MHAATHREPTYFEAPRRAGGCLPGCRGTPLPGLPPALRMRTLHTVGGVSMRGGGGTCFALAMLAVACGSNSNESSSNTAVRQVTLRVTTSGNGVVRGAGGDCRSSCSAQYAPG